MLEFGYITIPLMSFTAFVGLIVLMLLQRRSNEPTAGNGTEGQAG